MIMRSKIAQEGFPKMDSRKPSADRKVVNDPKADKIYYCLEFNQGTSVADPGFSPEGCANSQNCYYFSNFCRKLHENERIWTQGARVPGAPLDPPMHLPPRSFENFTPGWGTLIPGIPLGSANDINITILNGKYSLNSRNRLRIISYTSLGTGSF